LVPAAGRGERFGGAKLLTKWRDRELLGHVLLKLGGARAAGLLVNTIVMHRPDDDAIRSLAAEYRAYPIALRSSAGELSDTLRAGIEAITDREKQQQSTALLICLADQPLLRIEVIRALIDGWKSGTPAIRPAYRDSPGEPGHPLLIDRSLWGHAAEMRGESGFAPVLASKGVAIRQLPVGGSNPDVDTRGDLEALDLIPGVTAELRIPDEGSLL
jgi:molybdenum cofactor cytidylyltransferase